MSFTTEELKQLEEAIIAQVAYEPQKKEALYSLWSKIINARILIEFESNKGEIA